MKPCEVCKKNIPHRSHQAVSVRTCGPRCARELAVKEHPDIETSVDRAKTVTMRAVSGDN